MIDKIDVVMWTKNGERFLPKVLKRIDEVIPHESIDKKFLVDDHSVDRTIKIAKEFNWTVYTNPSTGIASGANEALRHVKSNFFISVEQDLLLAKDWWDKIPLYMKDEKVAVAQGVRLPTHKTLRKLAEYSEYDFFMEPGPLSRKRRKKMGTHGWVTLDNTIYRTDIIRKLGGFPISCPLYVDAYLHTTLWKSGFKWVVDATVISEHIRPSLFYELLHGYTYMIKRERDLETNLLDMLRILSFSPLRALHVVYRKRCP